MTTGLQNQPLEYAQSLQTITYFKENRHFLLRADNALLNFGSRLDNLFTDEALFHP